MNGFFVVFHVFSAHSGISKKIFAQCDALRRNGADIELCHIEIAPDGTQRRMAGGQAIRTFGKGVRAKLEKRVSLSDITRYIRHEGVEFLYIRHDLNANPLLVGWLKEIENFASLTLMFQKEVADRILAPVGSKDYGRISILSQLLCIFEKVFDLNPECFVPAPKIWSSVLLFTPLRSGLSAKDIAGIEKLSALAFGQRRKMIRQSLKSIPGLEKICCELQIPLTSRAEQITPNQFLALARRL